MDFTLENIKTKATYAIRVGKSLYALCPICADFHKIKRIPGEHKCKREHNKTYIVSGTSGLAGIKQQEVKAIDYGTHLLVDCPFCSRTHYHKTDTVKTLADCLFGIYTIIQKLGSSNKIVNTKRLELI